MRLRVEYDSADPTAPLNGAYKPAPDAPKGTPGAWSTYTWGLTQAAFKQRQNFGADLRIVGTAGIAVHRVILSLNRPEPGQPVPQDAVSLTFGPQPVEQGLTQVGAGGRRGDSRYHVETLDGKTVEVFDTASDISANSEVSYIYLKVVASTGFLATNPSILYATIEYAVPSEALRGEVWPESVFRGLRDNGIDYAEINLAWSTIEPDEDDFDFLALDLDLANAAAQGVKLIPIFWYSVWRGNPAPWIQDYDKGSGGAAAEIPTWWSARNQNGYFHYVAQTIDHIKGDPAFGGAFLNYGWLDYMWGPAPGGKGVPGYAPEDVATFHRWLPTQFRTLEQFNRQHRTAFISWDQVPAASPGQPLFSIYQRFRAWSVEDTYDRLTELVRRRTTAPLYYYFGGGLEGAGVAFNLPDIFFRLARKHNVTVVLDDANTTSLALLFGSLARAYGVQLLQEWTPQGPGQQPQLNELKARAAQWLVHTGLSAPQDLGQDFFIFQGASPNQQPLYTVGFPMYTTWLKSYAGVEGAYPEQPVAVYLSFALAFEEPTALGFLNSRLEDLWRTRPSGFVTVTDLELSAGVVSLSRFKAVLPLNGATDPAVLAYAATGGRVLNYAEELTDYAPSYAVFAPSVGMVEVVPIVDTVTRRAWIGLASIHPAWGYDGILTLQLAGLNLPDGEYHLTTVDNRAIGSYPVPGGLQVPLHLKPGDLELWQMLPGPGAFLATPPTLAGGIIDPQVRAVAGGPVAGLRFLFLDSNQQSNDGNLRLVTQREKPAVASGTIEQLRTGGAYIYLQLNPASPVRSARRILLSVTYFSTPGQGFIVQYNGEKGPYEGGPRISSTGNGAWVTATVALPDAQFRGAQNGGADLRLAVINGREPLYVHEVTITILP